MSAVSLTEGTRIPQQQLRLLVRLFQPLTASQLSELGTASRDTCSKLLAMLRHRRLVRCLSPNATRHRVYWLTSSGLAAYRSLVGREPTAFPLAPWSLYSAILYPHRSAVITSLHQPLQPSAIKRAAHYRDPDLRMSSNNCRDVVKWLCSREVLSRLTLRGEPRPRYSLTTLGQDLQTLILRARSPLPHNAQRKDRIRPTGGVAFA